MKNSRTKPHNGKIWIEVNMSTHNLDERTVRSFGAEWAHFDQSPLAHEAQTQRRFDEYFGIFPWNTLPKDAVGADVGCGSGRWAALVAPRVGHLHCLDASDEALNVARRNLSQAQNCTFHHASVDVMPITPDSLDFCYCLGVLHHIPDTNAGIRSCVQLLKPGAPLLLYLYYALDDRPVWFRMIWRGADIMRRIIARLPIKLKRYVAEVIARCMYWPLARFAALVDYFGGNPANLPLSWYRDKTLYTMRTNALDRFGTPIEHRFSRTEIDAMLRDTELEEIKFSDAAPFWCVVSRRKNPLTAA